MPASGPSTFLDSNVLLYLASADTGKADRAEALVAGGGVVSVQVLNEVANVAKRKMAMSWTEVHEFLKPLRALFQVVPLTLETHQTGLDIAERYGLSTYDGMIVAAALLAGCDRLLSEDMQHGLVIRDHLTIENPFRGP